MFKKLFFAAAILFSTGAAAEPIKNGVIGVLHAADMPFIIAREKGLLAARGVNIAPDISFSNNATVQVALSRGEIDIAATTGMFNIIQSRHNISGIKWVKAINRGPGIFLYANPNIKTVADLKGKKVSAGGLNDNTRLFAEIILNHHGLKFNDVEWFWSGSAANRLVALQSNQIDAAMLFPPVSQQAEAAGFRSLGVTSQIKMVANKGFAVNEAWALRNPDAVNKISDALNEAAIWLYDSKNLDEAAKILSTYTKTSVEQSREGILFYINYKIYETSNVVYREDIEYYTQVSRDWKNIKPDSRISYEELLWDTKNLK